MLGRNLFLVNVLCLCITGFPVNAYSKSGGHKHHAQVAEACKDTTAPPSLKCAQAPTARFDANGRLWVAWVYGGHVYLSASIDKGRTFNVPVKVNAVAEKIYAKDENRPKLAFGPKGQIYLSWTQKLKEPRFSGHIRFARSLDGGNNFSTPLIVNDHREATSHRFDVMAVNNKGDIYIAWLDKRDLLAAKKAGQAYNGAALYYALSTDNGKRFKPNKKIQDNTCQCCRVAMAMDSDQLPVILWRTIYGDNIRDHALVKFKGRNQAGTPVRASHDNWHIEGCPHHGPAISIADDGIYHLTWFNNAAERHGLFYARATDHGQSFSSPENFGDYHKAAAHADVLSLGQQVYRTWKEFDGKQAMLYVQQSRDGGQHWSTRKQLAATTAPADHPFLVRDKSEVYLSWHRQGEAYRLIRLSKP